jgi:DNA-3-methyladenine glycosylase II
MPVDEPIQFVLNPKSPYDFDRTVEYVTNNAGEYTSDKFVDGMYSRVLSIQEHHILLRVQSLGSLKDPKLVCDLSGSRSILFKSDEVKQIVSWMFSVNDELTPFYEMAAQDPFLHSLIKHFPGLQILRSPSIFESIVVSILGQQISAPVARRMRSDLIKIYGTYIEFDQGKYHTFPTAEEFADVSIDDLRDIGLSGRKAEYILGVSRLISSGLLSVETLRDKSDTAIVSILTSIDGIGPWTANWLLIRALGRPDGFPSNDLALRRALKRLFNKQDAVTDKEAEKMSLRWIPYRSLVTTYIFAALRNDVIK